MTLSTDFNEYHHTIIAITGFKRSGKDTVARIINRNLKRPFDTYAFADPVREAAKAFFGWPDSIFGDATKEVVDEYWGISPRQALQYIGTEVGRVGFAETFPEFKRTTSGQIWIKRFQRYVMDTPPFVDGLIVTDMRFHNEMDAVLDLKDNNFNVITIAVARKGLGTDGHASENEISEVMNRCQYQINNNSTLSDLEKSVSMILWNYGLLYNE